MPLFFIVSVGQVSEIVIPSNQSSITVIPSDIGVPENACVFGVL